jgi:CubicO group peptidase (beta-lactamase class C family)
MIKKIKDFVEKQVKTDEFSGAVLVVKKEQSIFQYSSGFAKKEKQIPNKIDTIFNIGSMDKMFTSVAIAQLGQQGKLSFQDKVGKYLPKLPKEIAEKMTVHHILTHAEGCSSYFNDKYIERRLKLKTVNDYMDLFIKTSLLFKPGEKYQYSNSGYVILGAIIESITDISYFDYVKQNIFKVAEMADTGSFYPNENNPRVANGYTLRLPFSQKLGNGKYRNNISELPKKGSPAGGGYSTCKDLYKFSQALLKNKLLSPKMTKVVLKPKVKIGSKEGQTLYYGYGFQILDVGDGNYRYGHAGAFAGANSRLDIYPWLGYTVVVLSNYDAPAAFRVANEAGKLILSIK